MEHLHSHNKKHEHTHGVIDPLITTSEKGIWAIKWSFIGLLITAILQTVVVVFSGSVALLADTIHNFGDMVTAVPLLIAFKLGLKKPTKRFTYGLGKVEDVAGVLIVIIILFSAIVAAYESIDRIINPQEVSNLWAVIVASVIGFVGNELVAIFRIKVGKEINSTALIADGYHARIDGFTSLAVLVATLGIWLGYPIVDPIIGILITITILKIVWDSSKAVFTRLLDGVDPKIIHEIEHIISHVSSVESISEIRIRWLGHRLYGEINIAVKKDITVEEGHNIAKEVRHQILHHLSYVSNMVIHIDPIDESGEIYH